MQAKKETITRNQAWGDRDSKKRRRVEEPQEQRETRFYAERKSKKRRRVEELPEQHEIMLVGDRDSKK